MSRTYPTIEDLQVNTRAYFRREREKRKQRRYNQNEDTNINYPVQRENYSQPITRNDTGKSQDIPNITYNIYNTAPKNNDIPDTKEMTRTDRFNFLAFSGIIITIVGVYLVMTDAHFKSIFIKAWNSTFGQLNMSSGIIILVIAILLVMVLFRKRS